NYGEGKIALVEAVRLTLENDPNLLLDAQDVERQRGILQEATGAFDWNLNVDLSYDYRKQRVRDSTLEREKEKRTDLAAQRDFTCAEEVRQRAALQNLQRFAGGDPAATLPNDVQQQVDFLDAIIAAEDNATQRQLLSQARSNLLTRAIDAASEGVTDLANGCVELNEDVANLGPAPEEEEIASGRFDLSLSKYFRSGITLTPYVTAGYDHNQFAGRRNGYFVDRVDENGLPVTTEYGTRLRRFVNFGGKNILDLYRTEIGFDINLPLLRGRGIESAGAQEKAAQIDLLASELILRHGSSTSTLSTALSYWQLFAAQQRVAVLKRSPELQTRIVDLTGQLIEGDVLPRVESARSAASQANARAQLEAARRDLVTARLGLARAMGLDVNGVASSPLAEGPFPTPPTPDQVRALDPAALAAQALDLRADRQATHELVASGKVLAEAARRDLASRLDLALSLSTSAIGEESFGNAVDRWTGPNGSFALAYDKSLGNNGQEGRYAQNEALLRQREISATDLDRRIRIAVVEILRSLEDAAAGLASAEAAAGHFQATIDAEFEKLGLGASTLIDAILTEQQKTSSDLAVIAGQQQVAFLLARLRFETGTMIDWNTGGGRLPPEALVTLPGSIAAGSQP
ncbi:MAG: TolC family protein, partial [Thermoanaerobaculia bacterium]|nr:TolC family protein [Thermoanaerobaculia bacterium]